MTAHGTVTEPGTIRFERMFSGPIERLWAYLTDSEKRGRWLASGPMELHIGGRVELNFCHADLSPQPDQAAERYRSYDHGVTHLGRITRCEPPHILSYTWGETTGDDSEVTFELLQRGDQVLLVLTHRRLGDRGIMQSAASGWHTHLAILDDHLHGREPRPFWTAHEQFEKEYESQLALYSSFGS